MSTQDSDLTAPDRENGATGVTTNDVGVTREELLAAIDATIKPFEEGDLVTGQVVKINKEEILVDIGYKSEGVIPAHELSIKQDVNPWEIVSLGDPIEALVLQKEDKEGRLILSKKRAQYEKAWGRIEEVRKSGGVVLGHVIEVVKGGLIVDIGLRGFLPASLVELRRVRDLQPYVGKELECKVIELDKNRNNVVLSRRAHLEEAHSEHRRQLLEELKTGERRRGAVSSIVNFGAFVDLGGVDGLIHVSELSWRHIDHPNEVVQVGQELEVEVLDVDLERERISLSLKNTQEDPWAAFARVHGKDDVIGGTVTKLVPFGAFVKVAEGIEGLVHISELSDRHIELPEQVVQLGQEVRVKVIEIDMERRRISLSRRQAMEQGETDGPAPDQEEAAAGAGAAITPEPSADFTPEPTGEDFTPDPAGAEPTPEPADAGVAVEIASEQTGAASADPGPSAGESATASGGPDESAQADEPAAPAPEPAAPAPEPAEGIVAEETAGVAETEIAGRPAADAEAEEVSEDQSSAAPPAEVVDTLNSEPFPPPADGESLESIVEEMKRGRES